MVIYSPGGHGSTVIIRSSRKPGTVKTARESCHSEHVGGGGGGWAQGPQYCGKFAVFFHSSHFFQLRYQFVCSNRSLTKSRYFNHYLWGSRIKNKMRRGKVNCNSLLIQLILCSILKSKASWRGGEGGGALRLRLRERQQHNFIWQQHNLICTRH